MTQFQIAYKDIKTKIIISFSSMQQVQICIPINSVLEFILLNQKKIMEAANEIKIPKQITFLSIRDLL